MDAQAQPPPRQAMLASRRGSIVYIEYQSVCPFVGMGSPTPSPASQCVSPLGPKGGEQHSFANEGAQFRQIDRKPGTLYILWGKLYKYTYLYTQRRNIQYKKGIWNLDHLLTWGIPYANTYGIPRNSAEFREKTTIKIPRNSAKFRGIPCVFQKIPYSAGSEKSTSVDTLMPGGDSNPGRPAGRRTTVQCELRRTLTTECWQMPAHPKKKELGRERASLQWCQLADRSAE